MSDLENDDQGAVPREEEQLTGGDLADHPEEVVPVEPPEPGDTVDDE